MRDPKVSGGELFHSTASMFTYHSGALPGSAAAQDGWPAFQALKDYIVLSNELTGFDVQADLAAIQGIQALAPLSVSLGQR